MPDSTTLPSDAKRVSIYQPEQPGRKFPEVPSFATHAEERQHRKQRLAAACRAFALERLDYGFAGHLTVRDPERPHLYWTNPMAVHFAQVKVSNLILVDHDGQVVEGDHAVNRAGFVLHAAVHEMHPDIVAMCHAHTIYGAAFASLGKKLRADHAGRRRVLRGPRRHRRRRRQGRGRGECGPQRGAAFKGVKAAIHQNHGLLTASRHSIDAAAFWFIGLERCCQQQLMIDATRRAAEAGPPGEGALQPRACRQRVYRLAALPADLRSSRAGRSPTCSTERYAAARIVSP